MLTEVELLIKTFFQKINITINSIDISKQELDNNKTIYSIKIKTKNTELLFGKNEKILDSVQSILRLMISKKVKTIDSNLRKENVKIYIEINDYSKSKNDKLIDFIKNKIKQLEKSQNDICLPYYGPYERKKIHGFVSELKNTKIYTKSIGEGKDRRLYICKPEKKLTIDIDSNDI